MTTDRLPQALRDERGSSLERASATPLRRSALNPHTREEHAATRRELPPTSLHELESWMVGAITERQADGVGTIVTPSARLTAAERLDIYQSGYCARLVECLADDYPALAASLGADRFEELAHAYVRRHPSRSPNLNAFGRHMPSFCRESDVLADAERVFYAELAMLEWAIVEVIHAEAAKPLDAAVLQKMTPDAWATARFARSEAVRLLHFAYPVNAFFQEFRSSKDGTPPKIPERASTATVVYREGPTVWRMDLTPAMARVLGALLDEATIIDALGRMGTDETDAEALAEAERSVMVWFREWVSGGMFAELVFESA
jgi:hypothetical protein